MSTSKPVLYAVIRDYSGELRGDVAHCAESFIVLEALAVVIEQLSKSCGIPAKEICDDLKGIVK